jgi:hypothetical protein
VLSLHKLNQDDWRTVITEWQTSGMTIRSWHQGNAGGWTGWTSSRSYYVKYGIEKPRAKPMQKMHSLALGSLPPKSF